MNNTARLLLTPFLVLAWNSTFAADAQLKIVSGVREDGRATELWQEILRKRLPAADFRSIRNLEKPFTAEERAWAKLIRSRVEKWEEQVLAVANVFRSVAASHARIVLGNRGGDDGFTHEERTIAFDLSALVRAYGDASKPENTPRMDRIFRHEYTHLLQRAWLVDHPYPVTSSLQAAVLSIWLEGAGNYYSMSDSWRANGGKPSAKARKTLAVLEPRFVTRLAALACASDEDASRLMADLSRGRFDRKWGALTAALWIEQDASVSEDALRNFVLAGPDGVWQLAERNLSDPVKRMLAEIKTAATICNAR